MSSVVKHLVLALLYGFVVTLLTLVSVYLYLLESRVDLKVWHTAELQKEFFHDISPQIITFQHYLEQEQQLFDELHDKVYQQIEEPDQTELNRFHQGSRMDPASFPVNWNRTFVLEPDKPIGGVLLLHGLSDAPYSLRAVGEWLHARGYLVIGLRLPGHGTTPSGLLDIRWQDWSAAVKLAVQYLDHSLQAAQPLYLFGYSNGAALAVEYTLNSLDNTQLRAPDRLVLFSPAIGVSGVASLAKWQSRIGNLLDLDKVQWESIQAEFDPYKYNSFTVNAGDQIYRLTQNIASRLGPGTQFPPVLAFMSVVDATVPPHTLVDALFAKLARGDHELVLYDYNRHQESEALLKPNIISQIKRSLQVHHDNFDLTVLSNSDSPGNTLVSRHIPAGRDDITTQELDILWPSGVFSLSHVAIPFPPDDPLYGSGVHPGEHSWITLGNHQIRGERGLLRFPDNYFLRLRHNPFYQYQQQRIAEFLGTSMPVSDSNP
ncbi:MAG: alpha/beta hydrolase [bacterium]